MKKMLPLLVVIALVFLAACGGGSSKEATPSPEATKSPAVEATPTTASTSEVTPVTTIKPTTTPKATPTPEPTPTPEVTPTPTPEQNPDAVGTVLESIMPNLIVAFAKVDEEWQGYSNPDVLPLENLENGQVYWWYSSADMSPEWSTHVFYQGWNSIAWGSPTAPIATALANYKDDILFVVSINLQTHESYLYQSPSVKPLTEIKAGQTYNTLTIEPGSPLPQMGSHTR